MTTDVKYIQIWAVNHW